MFGHAAILVLALAGAAGDAGAEGARPGGTGGPGAQGRALAPEELLRPRPDPAAERLAEGVRAFAQGDHERALALLVEAVGAGGLGDLEVVARVYGALAGVALGTPAAATEAVRLLRGMGGGTPWDDRAEGVLGRALAATGRTDDAGDAVRTLRGYLERFPGGGQAAQARRAIARALGTLGRDEERAEEERRIWALHPREAPQTPAPQAPGPTPDEILSRALALYTAHRHADVLDLLGPLLAPASVQGAARGAPGAPSKEQLCAARFLSGHTWFKRRKHAEAAEELGRHVAAECADDRDRALYLLGRARDRAGLKAPAIRAYEALAEEFPDRSYADDALLLKASVLADLGRDQDAARTLRDQVRRHPDGDMADEAWWRLAWGPYTAGRRREALKALDEALATGRREGSWYTRGRTLYWKGRILDGLKRPDEARAAWRQAVASYPLSYYALQAGNRLREAGEDPTGPAGAMPPPSAGDAGVAWRIPWRDAFDAPGFQRAVRLLRVGLGDEARRELEALGLLDARGDDEGRWLAAVLFERVGMPSRSHDVPRRLIPGFQDRPPLGEAVREWRLAYPWPYASEIAAAATEGRVPPELLIGLVREESGFDPDIESWANAIGLGQLLLSTARDVARGLPGPPVAVDAQALRQPALNLRLGARYLGGLAARFGHPALAAAGYNAGAASVAGWLKRFKGLQSDEWVEAIPYEQTRNYTKRVIESYGRYRFLYAGGDLVRLPLPLPQ